MFLRLVLVDLADRCANSVRVQHVAILELLYFEVQLLLRLHAYRSFNANGGQCVVEDDCV